MGLIILNGLFRILEGINTLNQVLYGWLVGVWLGFLFAFLLREPIFNHIKALVVDDYDMVMYGKTPLVAGITCAGLIVAPVIAVVMSKVNSDNPFMEQAKSN